MQAFEVTVSAVAAGDAPRIVVRGDLDAYRGDELRATLEGHLGDGGRPVELDASGVTFMDSGGLRVIVDMDERLSEQGAGLVLVDPSPPVMRLLRYTGLLGRFGLR